MKHPQIKVKKVTRAFVHGKGYSSAYLAAKALAMEEIKDELYKDLYGKDGPKEPIDGVVDRYDPDWTKFEKERYEFILRWHEKRWGVERGGRWKPRRQEWVQRRAREILKEQGLE